MHTTCARGWWSGTIGSHGTQDALVSVRLPPCLRDRRPPASGEGKGLRCVSKARTAPTAMFVQPWLTWCTSSPYRAPGPTGTHGPKWSTTSFFFPSGPLPCSVGRT